MNSNSKDYIPLRAAFATTDGQSFTTKHFGDADIYSIYQFDGRIYQHIENIRNSTEEEEAHGKVHKARSIVDLLKNRGVSIVVARRFGPNIKRIRKFLVPVLTDDLEISGTMPRIAESWPSIVSLYREGSDRKRHISFESTENKNKQKGTGTMIVKVIEKLCKGCERCLQVCPVDAIIMHKSKAIIKKNCVICGACIAECPVSAIQTIS
jgi:predicted Fe-Mo cluster-binding NifX family protein/ferredoxin